MGGENAAATAGPWRPSWARFLVLVAGVGVAASQWVRVVYAPGGDFGLHWAFGRRFLAHAYLYSDEFTAEVHIPYPPFWGMACAPMTLVSMPWAQTLLYPAAILTLAALTLALARMTRRDLPMSYAPRFWASAIALGLASRFLIRELPECGPNLLMVALAWLGFALWRRGRDVTGGAALGLAIAMKCTPALFVLYYALKRQWRMALASTAFAAAFTLAPVAWMGPSSYALHMRTWAGNAARGLMEKDPTVGVLGQEEVKNLSLRPTLGRFLVRLPEGHLGRLSSPGQPEGLGIDPSTAGLIVKGVILALVLAVGWTFRRPIARRDGLATVWEAAAVSLLILLLSPITWRQHCVGAFPALYLIARTLVARRGLPRWMLGALGVYALFVLVLDRGLVGKELTLVLDSYGVTTWSLGLLLLVVLGCRARVPNDRPTDAGRAIQIGPFGREPARGSHVQIPRKPANPMSLSPLNLPTRAGLEGPRSG